MSNPAQSIAQLIDHTILRADAIEIDIVRTCVEALQYGFASVCVNPFWVPVVARELASSAVKLCAVAGFPLGAIGADTKASEALWAIERGADEIDMVMNIGALRGGQFAVVEQDIGAVVTAAKTSCAVVKVILETALLNEEEKVRACQIAREAGADFVKTSTGFGPGGATEADVALMRRAVGPGMGVKASGGIRTIADVRKMIVAGANRIGASASVQIVLGAAETAGSSGY